MWLQFFDSVALLTTIVVTVLSLYSTLAEGAMVLSCGTQTSAVNLMYSFRSVQAVTCIWLIWTVERCVILVPELTVAIRWLKCSWATATLLKVVRVVKTSIGIGRLRTALQQRG